MHGIFFSSKHKSNCFVYAAKLVQVPEEHFRLRHHDVSLHLDLLQGLHENLEFGGNKANRKGIYFAVNKGGAGEMDDGTLGREGRKRKSSKNRNILPSTLLFSLPAWHIILFSGKKINYLQRRWRLGTHIEAAYFSCIMTTTLMQLRVGRNYQKWILDCYVELTCFNTMR